MPGQRFRRLIVAITIVDCLIVVAGAVVLLSGGQSDHSGPGTLVRVAAMVTVVALPLQCLGLWKVSQSHLADQTRLRRLRKRIDRVIANGELRIVFQPILDSRGLEVIGVEALSRFDAVPHAGPERWIADAELVGRHRELELLAITTALRSAAALPADLYIALNVSPDTFRSAALLEALLAGGVRPERLVLEITEHTSIADYGPLQETRAQLRALGIRLAVDDAGSGYASFRHIVALSPDIIKIDREIVSGVDHDSARSALVASVVSFAASANMSTVAEGVETPDELLHLKALGVDAIQGHLTGAPTACPEDWSAWSNLINEPDLMTLPPLAVSGRTTQTVQARTLATFPSAWPGIQTVKGPTASHR